MPIDLDVAIAAAAVAAEIIRAGGGGSVETSFKGAVDPVTEVDRAAEEAIVSVIRTNRPDDRLVGEERGGARGTGRVWFIDPLDGTVNYVHGVPHVAVSIAAWDGDEPLVGVIHDVWRDEVFAVERGSGVTLDGRAIGVSDTATLTEALVATGFPYDRQERAAEYSDVVGRTLRRVQGIRRGGSAALDLAWVACGRLDGYFEPALGPWDVAAGIPLVGEAGGTVSGYRGSPHRLGEQGIIATNGHLHAALTETVGERP